MQDITIQSLNGSNVLITEQTKSIPQNQTKYYITDEENADMYVSSKQNEKNINMFHKAVSVVLSTLSGIYLGAKMRANTLTRVIGGTAAAGGIYSGVQAADKYIDKQDNNAKVKRYNLEEVTINDERIETAIKPEQPEVENEPQLPISSKE